MARVPPTYVPLGEAVIKAACVWFAEEIHADGFTPDEIAALFRWKFAQAKVAARPSTAQVREGVRWKGIPVGITSQDRQEATETPEINTLRSRVNRIKNVPEEAYGRLRDLLSTAHMTGFIIDEHSGSTYKIEPHLWNAEDADTAHERGLMRFVRGQRWVIGPAVVLRSELENVLSDRPARTQGDVARPADPGSKGGRKPNPDADLFWIEICHRISDGEVLGGQAGFSAAMAEWAEHNMDRPYDADTVRKKISNLFKKLGWD